MKPATPARGENPWFEHIGTGCMMMRPDRPITAAATRAELHHQITESLAPAQALATSPADRRTA